MPAEPLPERAARVVEEFAALDDWVDRYRHLVEMGDELAATGDDIRSEENLIPGCQSSLWIEAAYDPAHDVIHFQADSDARITRGMAALLIRVLDGQHPAVIADSEMDFIDAIGLHDHLSAQRRNGLAAMIHWMKSRAQAVRKVPAQNGHAPANPTDHT